MSFPVGVELVTVTVGSALTFLGEGETLKVTVKTTLGGNARRLTWAATGQPVVKGEDTFTAVAGEAVTFTVPNPDQPGFLDGAGNAARNWSYSVTITAGREQWTQAFQPVAGQTAVDLDLVPDGQVAAPSSAPIPAVTAVNGLTGSVVVAVPTDAGTAGFVATGTDTKVAVGAAVLAAISPGGAAESQLNNAIAESTAAPKSDLSTLDRELSQATGRTRWEDAGELAESWAALTAWKARDVQVSGGKLYRATTPAGSDPNVDGLAVAAIPAPGEIGVQRIRASFTLPAAGTGIGYTALGVWAGPTGVAPATLGAAGLAFGIGFRETNVPIWRNGDSGGWVNQGAALPAGTYFVTVIAEPGGYSTVIEDTAGTPKVTAYYPVTPARANTGVWVLNTDTRHTAGAGIGPLAARKAIVTPRARAGVEDVTASIHRTVLAGQETRFSLPPSYDSRKPVPLVLYSHARSGTVADPWVGATPNGPLGMTQALMAAGFAVASNSQHGNNWGSQAAVDDLLETYRRFRDTYTLGPVVILAQSMGGMAALNALAQGKIPGVRGFYGIFPAGNLRNIYDAGMFTADIKSVYGIAADGSDYAAKTAGYDPALRKGWEFGNVPMRFHHSPADTLVSKSANSDLIAANVAPYTSEAQVITTSGEHGDPTNFNGADMIAFFKRCISG